MLLLVRQTHHARRQGAAAQRVREQTEAGDLQFHFRGPCENPADKLEEDVKPEQAYHDTAPHHETAAPPAGERGYERSDTPWCRLPQPAMHHQGVLKLLLGDFAVAVAVELAEDVVCRL